MCSLLLIYTGGTIGMSINPENNSLIPFDFNNLLEEIPEIQKLETQIDFISFKNPIDSSEISPKHWYKIAKIVYKNYNQYDGFIVLHGTDTMAYSASAVSFLLDNLSKPIIFTGSQIPIGSLRTDAKENLITSIEIASLKKQDSSKSLINEVLIYFEYRLLRGNRSVKKSVDQFKAFSTPNYPLIGTSGVSLNIDTSKTLPFPDEEKKLQLNPPPISQLCVIKYYPGINPSTVKTLLEITEPRVIILETLGAGNTTKEKWFLNFLTKSIHTRNTIILNITQCYEGMVKQESYSTGAELKKIGVISGKDLTFEAALTKSMCLMARYDNNELKSVINQNIKGEISN